MIERCPFRLTLAKDSLQVFSNLLVSKVRNDSNGAQRSNRLNDWNLELNPTGRSAADVEFHTCDPIRVDLCKLKANMPWVASVEEIRARFGCGTPRREFLFQQFQAVLHRLRATGHVNQIYLFGSFVTGKEYPNDIDLLVIMSAAFSTASLSGKDLDVFQHDVCRILFNADVFWLTDSVGADRIEDLLDVFSRNREGQAQPIIEVQL
jgi:hypothetical protein